jgi:prepilin-type processing-associated H-X9-DG protein
VGDEELWDELGSASGMYEMGFDESGELEEADDGAAPAVEERKDTEPSGPPPKGPVLPVGGFGSVHPGGSLFAFGDGHVRFLSANLTPQVYQQLGHRSDGKLLDSTDY